MSQPQEIRYAVKRRRRGPGWIWAIPIAVFGIVIWLFARELIARGPLVEVTFTSTPGVTDNTSVEFEGLDVGKVEAVKLAPDLKHVTLRIRMKSTMDGHLGPGTRFWISGAQISLTDLGSLRALVAGPSIGIDPAPGPTQHHFQGLAHAPVFTTQPEGTSFVLHATSLGSVKRGTPIYYRDLQVGQVRDYQLTSNGQGMEIGIFVRAPYDRLVHANTRFWNAGAVQVATNAAGPRVSVPAVSAIFGGAIDFETPDRNPGPRAKAGTDFTLYQDKATATFAPDIGSVTYHIDFGRPVAGLEPGAAVQLEGSRVGSVTQARMQYDPQSGRLATLVTVALDPRDITLAGDAHWAADPVPQMDAMLRRLIAQGLRAEVGSAVPVVGGKLVELRLVPHATEVSLPAGPLKTIPAGPSTGLDSLIADAGRVMANVNDVAAKIDGVPLDKIAAQVQDATRNIAQITGSAALQQSLKRLDDTLANVQAITKQANAKIGPTLTAFDALAHQAEKTVAEARKLLAGSGATQGPQTAGLPQTLYELSRAARSLRDLADYLDRHPGALLSGRR